MAILDIEYGREILAGTQDEAPPEQIQEMEMVLQNSSYGHEYAMLELQESNSLLEAEELSERLEQYKTAYFNAREFLSEHHPNRLETLEQGLAEQKTRVFKIYHA